MEPPHKRRKLESESMSQSSELSSTQSNQNDNNEMNQNNGSSHISNIHGNASINSSIQNEGDTMNHDNELNGIEVGEQFNPIRNGQNWNTSELNSNFGANLDSQLKTMTEGESETKVSGSDTLELNVPPHRVNSDNGGNTMTNITNNTTTNTVGSITTNSKNNSSPDRDFSVILNMTDRCEHSNENINENISSANPNSSSTLIQNSSSSSSSNLESNLEDNYQTTSGKESTLKPSLDPKVMTTSNAMNSTRNVEGNNTTIQPHDPIILPHKPLVNQSDLIRLMIQSLHSLNFSSIANNLQEVSGIKLYTNNISLFRNHILNGNYTEILSKSDFYFKETLNLQSEFYFNSVKLLILKQQYLEYLEDNNIGDSLVVLRNHLTSLLQADNSEELHHLASLLLCQNKEDLYERASWSGKHGDSRLKLINQIQKFVDPQLLIPENRLESLLLQAVEYQREHLCILQNPNNHDPSQGVSLLQREISPQDAVPDVTLAILSDHKGEVWNVQFSHNGQYLASVGIDKMCYVYNVHNLSTPFRSLQGHEDAVSEVSWSPNDKYLLTTSQDRKTKIWDVDRGECIATFDKCTTVCVWLPNSEEILCAGGTGDKYVNLYNIFTFKKQVFLHLAHPIQDMDLSLDGTKLVIVNRTKKFYVYNMNDLNHSLEFDETDFITSVKLSPCGRYALLNISLESSSSRISRVDMWDLEQMKKVREYVGHVQSRFVIRSCFGGNNGCFVVSGSEKNEVLVWLRSDGTLLTTLSGHTCVVGGVACNPRYPSLFASASDDHTVRVYHCSKNPFIPTETQSSSLQQTQTHA